MKKTARWTGAPPPPLSHVAGVFLDDFFNFFSCPRGRNVSSNLKPPFYSGCPSKFEYRKLGRTLERKGLRRVPDKATRGRCGRTCCVNPWVKISRQRRRLGFSSSLALGERVRADSTRLGRSRSAAGKRIAPRGRDRFRGIVPPVAGALCTRGEHAAVRNLSHHRRVIVFFRLGSSSVILSYFSSIAPAIIARAPKKEGGRGLAAAAC